jgi:hypothetical protein
LAIAAIWIAGSIAFGNAENDYAELFGRKAATVKASSSKLDDVGFAKELMESAGAVSESPKLQILLYEKLLPFAAAGSAGLPIGLQALDALEKAAPARIADWRVHRVTFLRAKYLRALSRTKKDAATAYLDGLLAAADALVSSGKASEALTHYRLAQTLAARYYRAMVPEIRQKSTLAATEALVEGKMKKLQAGLKTDPNDTAVRQELITLYIIQKDSPADAADILNHSVSEDLRTHVPLAFKSDAALSEDECLKLGKWYYRTLGAKASGAGKFTVLKRADRYYKLYLERHEKQDVPRAQAKLAIKRIETELARLAPRKPITTVRPPKDAVAAGRHRYKVFAANIS